jgi:hypothetical protein
MAIIDNLRKISETVWELLPSYKAGMRVPARIIATEKLVREMDEAVYQQISNVATLPGVARYASRGHMRQSARREIRDHHSKSNRDDVSLRQPRLRPSGRDRLSPEIPESDDSRQFTRYVVGKTGGDGVHYNNESGEAWARPVIASIDQILAADIATRRRIASNR